MTPDRLDLRALNRATLERQLLLRRSARTPLQAVGHLAGLQAQAPKAPYVGLWTRLAGFRHQWLEDLVTERSVVRAHLMRNTVHLVDAADFVSFRPLFQPLAGRGRAPPGLRGARGRDTGCPVLPRYRDSWTESVDPARSGQLTDPGPQRDGQGITVGAWTTRRSWLTSAS